MVFLPSVRRLLVTASVVTSSPILVTLTRATRRSTPEDAILLVSYVTLVLTSPAASIVANLHCVREILRGH
jgi:hypothetical protein